MDRNDIGRRGRGQVRHDIFRLALVPLVLAASGTSAGCSSTKIRNAGEPWVICGTTLTTSLDDPPITDASAGGAPIEVKTLTSSGILILASKGCENGAQISIRPPAAGTLAKVAKAKDKLIAAAIVTPHQRNFLIEVTPKVNVSTTVDVNLQGELQGIP